MGTNVGGFQFDAAAGEAPFPTGPLPDVGGEVWLLVAGVVALAVLAGLLFLLVGAVMEFVLVESLRTERVRVREYWGTRWRQGLRLFGFRLVLGLVLLGAAAALFGPIVFGAGGGVGVPTVGLLLFALPAFVVVAVAVSLVNGFTTAFVVPIMVLTDAGVLAGWRRLWSTVRADWKQYVVYVLANVVLTVTAGLFLAMVGVAAALVLLLPFGLLALVGAGLLTFAVPIVGIAVLVVVALLYGLALAIVVALAQGPVVSYLRYYAMLVLGDVDESLDLVATQRAAAREEESGTAV